MLTDGLIVGIPDADVEGEPVLPEGVELVGQLLPGLGHRLQVPKELQEVGLTLQHLAHAITYKI